VTEVGLRFVFRGGFLGLGGVAFAGERESNVTFLP
jgi:hypothetical protein